MELTAGPDDAGARLDAFLAGPLGSRSRAERLIAAGHVTVDGAAAPKRHRLAEGQLVMVDEEAAAVLDGPAQDDGAPAPYDIAYEDDHLIVVDKPAGVVVHPARGNRSGTLSQALVGRGAAGGDDPWRAGLVHRLDRDTSGLLVGAQSDDVHPE